MKKLKIGVIGTGHMGRNHVRNIAEDTKRFEFIGIYDTNYECAKSIAEKYSITPFNNMEKLFSKIDAVVIAVPSTLHKDIALKAAEYGIHALVEKPLATSSKDAEIIAKTFETKHLKLAVGHIERFNPVFEELQKLVDSNNIFYIEACRYSPFSGSGRITDTSVIEDLMIHDVDLVCSLFNMRKLSSIYGRGESIQSDKIDFATCVLDFEGKAHAIINASRISQNKERSITIHTVNCCIHADLLSKTLEIYKSTNLTIDLTNDNSYKQDGIVQKIYVPIAEPLKSELTAFYESVINGTPLIIDGKIGVNAIKICEEISRKINSKEK